MINLVSMLFLTVCSAGASFQFYASPAHRATFWCNQQGSLPIPLPPLRSSASDAPDNDDLLDLSGEETILRINFSFDSDNGNSALAAVQTYTKSFPFAAVLPVQPLSYLPGEHRGSGNLCEENCTIVSREVNLSSSISLLMLSECEM